MIGDCKIRRALQRALFPLLVLAAAALAQQAAAPKLSLATTELPRAIVGHAYGFRIEARGGEGARSMKVAAGSLPPGLDLDPSGWITGVATTLGGYSFSVEVTDESRPPQRARREFTLKVLRPLAVEWAEAPAVRNGGIYGRVAFSNTSERTADVTVIVVAVNEYGKAFALGYTRGPMATSAAPQQLDFGAELPAGSYSVRVDVVGEMAATGEIWRDALADPGPLLVPLTP